MTVAAGPRESGGLSGGGPQGAPGWQRVLRAVTAALLGVGMAGGIASAAWYWTRPDPSSADLDDAGEVLVPDARIGEAELRSLDDVYVAGPRELSAPLDPPADLDDVQDRADAAGLARRRDASDEVVVDVGRFVAQVRPGRLDVVRDERSTAAVLVATGGLVGGLLLAVRSWRRSGHREVRRSRRWRLVGAAFALPLGLLYALGWLLTLSAPWRLDGTIELGGAVIGATILLAGFWVPAGVVAAFFAWLASRARAVG